MKHQLPDNHGLSETVTSNFLYFEDELPSLTDAQYMALENGLGTGSNLLVVAPTSTGKTQIATWAICHGVEKGCNNVYLVTHRALAKQKFIDFQDMLSEKLFGGERSGIVLANGDTVVDGEGNTPADPLGAPLVVATYEKYLAMLSASGVPASMQDTVIVCDEIQLIGDKHRGQNVEILLTLLKSIGWRQFIGLSAVLSQKDSEELADWLGIKSVRSLTREKELSYEYWSEKGIEAVKTTTPEVKDEIELPREIKNPKTLDVVNYFRKNSSPLPVIVFCMRKADVYDLANSDLGKLIQNDGNQLPLYLGDLPETSSNSFLSRALVHRIAIHSADLTDDERKIVEDGLLNKEIDVVYATTTLAAGVNFPLGVAIFHSWMRWDGNLRKNVPISTSEFHNMAGRVGRMGTTHTEGRVVFFPHAGQFSELYKQYLDLDQLPPLGSRITEETFDQLALQLISTGLCKNRDSVKEIIATSFSGVKQQDNNIQKLQSWPASIDRSINDLVADTLVIELNDGTLMPTPVGKAVAQSGLKPRTSKIVIEYFSNKGSTLSDYINQSSENYNLERFYFLVFSLAFSTPEFNNPTQPSRYIPYPIRDLTFDASSYSDDLFEPQWFIDKTPTNAADVALRWVSGEKLSALEKLHNSLRAGMILEMYRNLGWVIQGIASVLSAASDYRNVDELRPIHLRGNLSLLQDLRKIPRSIARLSVQLSYGLPDSLLWTKELNHSSEPFRLTREEALDFLKLDFYRPEQLMLGDFGADELRMEVFNNCKPSPTAKSNWLRNRCRLWKSEQREKAAEKHKLRSRFCPHVELIDEFYDSRQEKFETAFENILDYLSIKYTKLDDGQATGAPDYLLFLKGSPSIVVELKSKKGSGLINFNSASEVLAASEIHGYKENFCVTLCHPGVDPSVPMSIIGSGRLSVVESADLGEAFLRLCQKRLSQEQLWEWLATPGQAVAEDIPYTDHSNTTE